MIARSTVRCEQFGIEFAVMGRWWSKFMHGRSSEKQVQVNRRYKLEGRS
ncbi:hypothetical protein [Microcoleus sp. herbarium14]